MTDTLLIDYSKPATSIPWAAFSAGAQQQKGTVADLSELSEYGHNHKVYVWISGEKVTLTQVDVPSGQQRHLEQILPSLLEDNLASDIDELHFAIGDISEQGRVNVAVIERDELTAILDEFEQHHLTPHLLLADSLAVPVQAEHSALQVEGERSVLRTEPQYGYVLDTANLGFMIKQAFNEQSNTISLYCSEADRDGLELPQSVEWRGEAIDKLASLPDVAAMSINLLQGEFKTHSVIFKYWQQWRAVFFLVLLTLIIHLGSVGLETWRLNQQAADYKNQVKQSYLSAFPNEKRVVNAKAQMTQHLAQLQGQQTDSGFLILLQKIAPALKQFSAVEYTRISYEQSLDELRLDIKAQDYSQLESLKDSVAKLNLHVELGSVSGSKGYYSARLMIRSQQ